MDLTNALKPGLSGTSYDSQIQLAIAYWQSLTVGAADGPTFLGTDGGAGSGNDSPAAASQAVTLLQAEQARIRNPAT